MKNDSEVWRLGATSAVLCTPQLTACVDLLNPHVGLNELEFGESTIDGYVLGISPGAYPVPSESDLVDKFARGNDLVVTYAETNERPFSLQIYWRVTANEHGALALDAILSLQTDLLESFPGVAVETKLPVGPHQQLDIESADAHLIRSGRGDWSYAEATHPDDSGETEFVRSDEGRMALTRQLGGRFLEKGVIRRLRVRGVFLPQENDEAVATECLRNLATEEPPLTV